MGVLKKIARNALILLDPDLPVLVGFSSDRGIVVMLCSNVVAENISNTLLMLAIAKRSSSLMELAIALRAISTGKLWLPNSKDVRMAERVVRLVWDPEWNRRAHGALTNVLVHNLAWLIDRQCLEHAPLTPNDSLGWGERVKAIYEQDASMQTLAAALIEQLNLPKVPKQPSLQRDIPDDRFMKYLKLSIEMKQHFDRHVQQKQAHDALAASWPPSQQPIVTSVQAEPAPANTPPIAKPARTPPRTDVMRIVVPWSNCASIPLWQMLVHEAEPDCSIHEWVPITPRLPLWTFVHPRAQGLSLPS